jgi:hypothetical protein
MSRNLKNPTQDVMEGHLNVYEKLHTYSVWPFHGEPYRQPGLIDPLLDVDPYE